MLRRLMLSLAVALVAASAALAAPGKLAPLSAAPFAVRGTSFQPREHVLVVVASDGDHASKRLQAGAGGGFVARFPTIQVGSCAAYTVRATGDEGSHALLKVRPPECPQPLTP